MLTCALPLSGFGMVRFLVPSLVYPQYMEQQEHGRWAGVVANLPAWLAPKAPAVARAFYEGQSPVPWAAWALPLAAWSALFLALIAAQLSLTVLLRKQWIESERLTFPIVYLPLRMTQQGSRFFADRLMWLGFAGPFIMQRLSAINYLYPWVPAVQLKATFITLFISRPWSAFGGLPIGYYPIAIGLAYFILADVSFSCWFFYFLMRFLSIGAAALGLDTMRAVTVSSFPYREEQAARAWMALATVTLWLGRRQLAEAYRAAIGAAGAAARDGAMYRWAAVGLVVSLGILIRPRRCDGLAGVAGDRHLPHLPDVRHHRGAGARRGRHAVDFRAAGMGPQSGLPARARVGDLRRAHAHQPGGAGGGDG
jgi:hypothetical protein